MSEPTLPDPGPSPEAAAEARARRACNWHRVRVYSYSIILMLTMWFCGALLTIRLHPERIVHAFLAQLPYPSSTGNIYWLNRRTLVIDNMKLGDFFYAGRVVIIASPVGLWRHHIAKVQVLDGQLFTGPLYSTLLKNQSGQSNGDGLDWVIGRLEITRGTVVLDNLIPNTSIPVRLGMRHPIFLNGLRLGKPDATPEMSQERTAEIGAVNITSPVDPLAPVLFFPLTKITYTYEEIWHHRIRAIEMIRPTIFLGEDLFWLTKQFKSEYKAALTSQGVSAPWIVDKLHVSFGRLAVNVFGQPIVHFPFFFGTNATNVRLDQVSQISAKSVIAIADLTQDYPDYKVKIAHLKGRLYFSWPPSDANANNVVNTLHIDSIAWNDIPATNVSATMTYDEKGIYGTLTNATCEGGLLNGSFGFYYTAGFKWNADFFAKKVNCQPIAEKLIGKYAAMTGEIDGKLDVEGQATHILHCAGSLSLPTPGTLEIKSVDDLLKRVPPDMMEMKKEAIKLAIDAFKTYPYNSGQLTISYRPGGGMSLLHFDGPRGTRDFSVYLHPYPGATLPGTSGE